MGVSGCLKAPARTMEAAHRFYCTPPHKAQARFQNQQWWAHASLISQVLSAGTHDKSLTELTLLPWRQDATLASPLINRNTAAEMLTNITRILRRNQESRGRKHAQAWLFTLEYSGNSRLDAPIPNYGSSYTQISPSRTQMRICNIHYIQTLVLRGNTALKVLYHDTPREQYCSPVTWPILVAHITYVLSNTIQRQLLKFSVTSYTAANKCLLHPPTKGLHSKRGCKTSTLLAVANAGITTYTNPSLH